MGKMSWNTKFRYNLCYNKVRDCILFYFFQYHVHSANGGVYLRAKHEFNLSGHSFKNRKQTYQRNTSSYLVQKKYVEADNNNDWLLLPLTFLAIVIITGYYETI